MSDLQIIISTTSAKKNCMQSWSVPEGELQHMRELAKAFQCNKWIWM